MERKILHCDMNSFFASVELLDYPELRDVPVAVAGNPEQRHGIILAKNEAAKKFGVVTAETIQQALRKCPNLKFLPPHHDKYSHYSKLLNEIYRSYTDLVEPFSIDESWLDVTGSEKLFGTAEHIADEIRQRVRETYGLTLSVGVSYNKIFAKMGSEYKKPDATTVITEENYRELLWPQPVEDFFYVGHATAEKMRKIHIYTIGELAQADPKFLKRAFGSHGEDLHRYANGWDDSPVRRWGDWEDVKSVGHGVTFRRNLRGRDDVAQAVTELSDWVSSRLRLYEMKAYGVKVEITTPNFRRVSKQRRYERSFVTAQQIRRAAMELVEEMGFMNQEIRLLTITAIHLVRSDAPEQLSIFDLAVSDADESTSGKSTKCLSNNSDEANDGNNASCVADDPIQSAITAKQEERIERTMDQIREKFGNSSIGFAHTIGNDLGLENRKKK